MSTLYTGTDVLRLPKTQYRQSNLDKTKLWVSNNQKKALPANRRQSVQHVETMERNNHNAFLNQMRYEKKAQVESELDWQIKTMFEKPKNNPRLGSIDALDMFNFDSVRDQNTFESKRKRGSVQLQPLSQIQTPSNRRSNINYDKEISQYTFTRQSSPIYNDADKSIWDRAPEQQLFIRVDGKIIKPISSQNAAIVKSILDQDRRTKTILN